MEAIKKKPFARLNPLDCELCKIKTCCYFGMADEMRRLGLTIRFEDCARQNGGKVRKAEAVQHG